MPHDYVPKSEGETLLRHQVARARARISKLEKDGKEYKNPIISIAFEQAVDIVNRHKERKEQLETVYNLVAELSFQLENEYVKYDVTAMRNLANKILVRLTEIKK
jgi:predicted nucleotidyltransferase